MSKIGLALMSAASLLVLAGCDTVQLNYKAAATDPAAVLGDAQNGYHYFELPRSYIVFAKASPGAGSQPGNKNGAGQAGNGATDGIAVAGGANGIPVNRRRDAANNAPAPQQGQAQAQAQGQAQAQAPANQTGNGQGTGTATQLPSWPNQTIGPDTWAVSVIPVPSDKGLMVKGDVGYWQSTTLGIGRYTNSYMPSTISSKAENLVATRIGQGFSLLADITPLLGVAVAGGGQSGQAVTGDSGLEPFSIKVIGSNDSGTINPDWDWALTYNDNQSVPDSVSYDAFNSAAASANSTATVGYWPVPACRDAVLTLTNKTGKTTQGTYTFHVTVGTPEFIRPELLPVDGSLDLGSVCSGSTKGTMDANPGTDGFNIADSFLKGLKPATSSKAGAPQPANPAPGN